MKMLVSCLHRAKFLNFVEIMMVLKILKRQFLSMLSSTKKSGTYEVLKVPDYGFSMKSLIYNEMRKMQEITKDDLIALGFNDSIYYEGKNYDTLTFDPDHNDLKIVRSYHYFNFVCLHKRIKKPGDKCAGTLAECNNRGTCFEGKCYCLDGYINDPCICKTISWMNLLI